MTDAIRRSLGPIIRTVANATVQKAVPPAMQPAAKAAVDFAVSSFEQGKPARAPVALNVMPPPTVILANPAVVTPPTKNTAATPVSGTQGDGQVQPGDKLAVAADGDTLNLRPEAGTTQKPKGSFPTGARLEVATPPGGGSSEQNGFVYVSGPGGETGWVSAQYTRELTAEEAAQPASTGGTTTPAAAAYQSVFVDQFAAEKEVGGDASNANCGPSSTLTALLNEGLEIPDIPGIEHNGTTGADVQAVRYWGNHADDSGSDGVYTKEDGTLAYSLDGKGNENSTFTGFTDVANAVAAAGGTTANVAANSTAIMTAIDNGSTVVISGTFVETKKAPEGTPEALVNPENGNLYVDSDGDGAPDLKNGVPNEWHQKADTWKGQHGSTMHLVAVVGRTPEGNFIVCDPAHTKPTASPIELTPSELDAFMRGNAGAIAVNGASTSETETPSA
ncbi:hypothetical protein LXT21_11240 [Myxococcus sp. K38C18041901]|uniref:SH3 domain-containing protein n=1 Tax=Myxococcus guangdongensis TaxID=2906760 RepID=UPI0020A6FFE5|nr:hypothetical protein [Myxococcus guangdongensis]MCP3059348.1 hypothetical protein [Myxococcus guangdongensis]